MARIRKPQQIESHVVFDGPIFHVDRDRVRLSNGRHVSLDVVGHRGSVVLIPQPAPDRLILIRQFRYAIGQWIWELPAGSLDPGERPGAAARRECEEEIGLTPRVVRRLRAYYPTPGFCDEVMIFYLCEGLTTPTRPVAKDEDEQIEPRECSVAEADTLVARGDIVDMKTVIGLDLIRRRQSARTRRVRRL